MVGKISEMTAAAALTGAEMVEVTQSGATRRTTTGGIAALAAGAGTNLTLGTVTSTEIPINSSTGTDVTLTSATVTLAGLQSAADKLELLIVDHLAQAVVVDKDISTPPGSPANGSMYIVASGNWGTGSNQSGKLALWLTAVGAWTLITPVEGWSVWVTDEAVRYEYKSGVWSGEVSIAGSVTLNGNNRSFRALMDASASAFTMQTSTLNGTTTLEVIPNGSATAATLRGYNKADKGLQFFTVGASSGSVGFVSWAGGGSQLPLTLGIGLSASWQVDASTPWAFRPGADNTQPLGTASFRCSTIYAGTGTINTSDAREKTTVRALTGAEIECGLALSREIGGFKFLSAIEEKGEAARTHIGMTVQRAIELLTQHGLSPFEYSFICYDQWPEQLEVVDVEPAIPESVDGSGVVIPATDEKRVVLVPYLAAGDRYSFRETGLIQFIQRAIVADRDALEARIAALEVTQ